MNLMKFSSHNKILETKVKLLLLSILMSNRNCSGERENEMEYRMIAIYVRMIVQIITGR